MPLNDTYHAQEQPKKVTKKSRKSFNENSSLYNHLLKMHNYFCGLKV